MKTNDLVHKSHCCRVHGCKYNDYNNCPVTNREILQDNLCEFCDDILAEEDLLKKVKELQQDILRGTTEKAALEEILSLPLPSERWRINE